MSSACTLVHRLAGAPSLNEVREKLLDAEGVCAVCGDLGLSAPIGKMIGQNFTDQYWLARADSNRICRACSWCLTGKPPRTVRMWSIVAADGVPQPPSAGKAWLQDTHEAGLCLTSRGDTTPVIDTLTAPPDRVDWVVAVAISGQKHVLPFAQVNHGRGRWSMRMETCTITAEPADFQSVLTHAAHLRDAKYPTDAVLRLQPGVMKSRAALDLWTEHATPLTPYRESPLLELALWCLTTKGIIHALTRCT